VGDACRLYPDWDVTRTWELPPVPVKPEDEDLESYLRRIGFTEAQLGYTQRGFAGAAAEAMRNLSARASLDEMHDETAGVGDFRILDGYGRLHEALAEGLDIRLNTPIDLVEWGGDSVRVRTVGGESFEADRVVITLPLGVLKAGSVRFTPELPDEKQSAINCLIAAPVIKMIYRFAEPVLPDGVMALYSALNPCMWWSPSFGHETSEYVITAFVTADRARELLALGEADALEQGVAVLRTELNRPDFQPLAARMVNWVADPYSLGGYTATPPGQIDAHEALAAPVGGKLYWAGEATAGHVWKATVHGAYASGLRVAAQILSDNAR
jgi:monoamine oxidase